MFLVIISFRFWGLEVVIVNIVLFVFEKGIVFFSVIGYLVLVKEEFCIG